MQLDPKVLRESFQLVVERTPDLVARFYETLFRNKPELAPLFHRRPRAAQERMLGEALGAVLDHLEDAPWLRDQLAGLGARHADYGITRPMYDDVGAALLETMALSAGSAWTPGVEAQWRLAYGVICEMMWAGTGSHTDAGERRDARADTSPSA